VLNGGEHGVDEECHTHVKDVLILILTGNNPSHVNKGRQFIILLIL
jgi:hypothetical protein